MENTPKEIVVTVPESLAGISIRKDIHYSDDTVISIRVEEHDPGRYSGSGPDFTFYAKGHDRVQFYLDDVVCLEANSNYTIIHFKNDKEERVRIEFRKFEEQLKVNGYSNFIRIHSSYIVNTKYISRISKHKLYLRSYSFSIPIGEMYRHNLQKVVIFCNNPEAWKEFTP